MLVITRRVSTKSKISQMENLILFFKRYQHVFKTGVNNRCLKKKYYFLLLKKNILNCDPPYSSNHSCYLPDPERKAFIMSMEIQTHLANLLLFSLPVLIEASFCLYILPQCVVYFFFIVIKKKIWKLRSETAVKLSFNKLSLRSWNKLSVCD